ncbi:p27 [Angelonia flower break virus]|nr:p27 [Angelonia flower break virus]ABB29869.1 p27 [Angelonia flower break virus]
MGFFRDVLKCGAQNAIGCTLITGAVAVGIAALEVRAAIGAYEFTNYALHTSIDYIRTRGESLQPVPQYPSDNTSEAFGVDLVSEESNLSDHLDTIPEETDGSKVVRPARAIIRRHARGKFSYCLAMAAKNAFGGTPTNTKANQMSVMRFMVGKCGEHHLTDASARVACAEAMSVCFTPDISEINMFKGLNSHAAYLRTAALREAKRVDCWWYNLLLHPLAANAWQRAWMVLNRLGDLEAFEFIK